ncbi:CGNR zinc finger domain-containing protein [Streptomyces sp. NPDC051940]|uniref:CGNR zinc finger domain-containing protein n=1 Tax=Streptomyces sp. NPDC051940 TaxID=3155675 RepID=UPI00343934FE
MHKHGFRPAERLIDLANAVREDPALPRDALADLLERHGETGLNDDGDSGAAAFTDTDAAILRLAVRRLIDDVLTATDTDRAALALNAILEECGARPRLSRHDGHAWHLHVDRSDDASWSDWLLASSAHALAQLLGDRGRVAWSACAAASCGRFFLLTGPGSPRRYCSTACGTRERVAAHRRRHA